MIDWQSYFRNAPDHNVYAKDAKEIAVGGEKVPFADLHTNSGETPSLEDVVKGRAIELWSDALGERFWLVADEADAARLRGPRGNVYTAAEARRIVKLGNPEVVAEIHTWKRRFDGVMNSK
jgi:hypothetical protein